MSTATTLKRVALVAVYALGFGMLAVAPSKAVVNSDSLSLSSATGTHLLGSGAATVTATIGLLAGADGDFVLTSVVISSAPTGSSALPTFTTLSETDTVNVTPVSGSGNQQVKTTAVAAGLRSGTAVISLTPAIAGTYVVTVSQSVGGVVTRSTTWTVTSAAPTLGKATAFISNLAGFADSAPTSDTGTLTAPAAANSAAVARIAVNQYSDAAGTVLLGAAYTGAVAVSVSGAGSVGKADNTATRGPSSTTDAAGANQQAYFLFADGRSGPATVTISVGGSVVATKTFTFVGTAAAAVVDATTLAKNIGVGEVDTITYNAVDAAGNKTGVDTALDFALSSDTTVATIVSAVDGTIVVRGVKPGTANITVCSTATCASTGISSAAQAVMVHPVTLGSVSMTLDKASYAPGEKMTLTVRAVDTSTPALAIADGTRTVFSTGPTTNVLLGAGSDAISATSVALVSGVKTYTLYAPLGSGTITISGADATTAKTAVSVSAVVVNPAQESADAATDAALEAIDAANAATDAANLAAEAADAATVAAEEARDAADAATAAVEALAAEVTTMIAEIKAQLTALANVVAKIAKKVKA